MVQIISVVSVIMAAILFIAAIVDVVLTWSATTNAKKAVTKAAEQTEQQANAQGGGLAAQAAPDFKSAWEGLAALAAAIKDLDRSSRLLVLSLAFLAVAGALTGVDSIADAIEA